MRTEQPNALRPAACISAAEGVLTPPIISIQSTSCFHLQSCSGYTLAILEWQYCLPSRVHLLQHILIFFVLVACQGFHECSAAVVQACDATSAPVAFSCLRGSGATGGIRCGVCGGGRDSYG